MNFVSGYLKEPAVTPEDVVWTYSGVRPLYDDGAKSATAATRDYVLSLNTDGPAPLLNVFGGKITTYRKLAEHALEKLAEPMGFPDGGLDGAGALCRAGTSRWTAWRRCARNCWRTIRFWALERVNRLIRVYGTDAWAMLGEASIGRRSGARFRRDHHRGRSALADGARVRQGCRRTWSGGAPSGACG